MLQYSTAPEYAVEFLSNFSRLSAAAATACTIICQAAGYIIRLHRGSVHYPILYLSAVTIMYEV